MLLKEENDLKEKLQIEVTKVKEKLENFLSESNKVIKTNEKLNKGIKNIEKDKEQNFIKSLSYLFSERNGRERRGGRTRGEQRD